MRYAILRVDQATMDDITARLKAVDEKIAPGSTEYQREYIKDAGSMCGDPKPHIVFGPIGLEAEQPRGSMDNATKIACWDAVEQLRSYEGDDVRILCDNPDGPCAVEVNGAWTDYKERRYEGRNVYECLMFAIIWHSKYYANKNPELTAPVKARTDG